MQILLLILKIIGIILLLLLGVVMLALVLILFVPIHYEISGEIGDEHKIEAGGVIRYLFSILKIVIAYQNGELKTDIYLFGFRKRKNVLETEESETSHLDAVVKDIETRENLAAKDSTNKSETIRVEQDSKTTNSATKSTKEKELKTKSVKGTEDKENSFPFELIKKELTDKHNHSVLKKVIRELKYLFLHFGFRKIKTDLIFGAGDPALTGQILGILAMFPILYRYEFGIVPDFETDNAYIKGTFAVKGRIRPVHILMTACRLIFDKEVRMAVKKFMDMQNQ